MAQNSEQIEAKLCAYLEGELDEQGRAEIEKHLEAKPAHRKLLAEVAGTRDLLRALPREAAPADLCETLQGHLERSVLLDDVPDEHVGTYMRIGRWRPVMAMAAMVVLAVGLGLVIYFGLPSAASRQSAYSVNSPRAGTSASSPAATLPSESVEADAEFGNQGVKDIPGESASTSTAPARGLATARGAGTGAATSPANEVVPESLSELAQRVPKLWSPEKQREFFAAYGRDSNSIPGSVNSALYFVVSTPEPAAAREEVTQELEKLQVTWEAVQPATVLAMGDVAGAGAGSGLTSAALGTKPAEPGLAKKSEEAKATSKAGVAASGAAGAPAARGPTVADAGATAVAPLAEGLATQDAKFADKFAADVQSPSSSTPAAQTMILARNVTRRQAETLRASLNGRRAERQIAVWSAQRGGTPEPAPGSAPAPALQDLDAAVNQEIAEATPPAPAKRDAAAPKEQVALRTTTDPFNQTGDRSLPQRGGAGGGFGGGPGERSADAGGKDAGLSRPAPDGGASRRRSMRYGEAPAGAEDAARGREQELAATGPSPAKEDVSKRGQLRELERPTAQAQKARPSPRGEAGREVEGRTVPTDETNVAAGDETPPAGKEKQTKQVEAMMRSSPETHSTTGPVDAVRDDDERVDLLILVKGTDAPGVGAGGAEAAPSGPIERYEILTVTIGDADGTNVRVGEDGTIELPSAGRITAEGLTADALGKKISESLGRANVDSKITVSRPGAGNSGAATQPEEKTDRQPQTKAADADSPRQGQKSEPAPSPEHPTGPPAAAKKPPDSSQE